jgi:hypothetical protein
MKRDIDLLRHLLRHVETDGKHEIPMHYDNEQRAYHVELLERGIENDDESDIGAAVIMRGLRSLFGKDLCSE